jgi:3-deoxy-D-manno-octulosonic-acid transferase
MRILYNLFLHAYHLLVRLAAPFSVKAALWVRGRRGWRERMQRQDPAGQPLAWFHCASLGEFEQGRPVMERFREAFPGHKVLLTFFSPSGYEVRKAYAGADYVHYLPLDTPSAAGHFLEVWKPSLAVFIKYEFWFNMVEALAARGIPLLVVSAIFRPQQHFFRWYGGWFRRRLRLVTHFLVQNQASLRLLNKAGISRASISGDTRFDRVVAIARQSVHIPELDPFLAGSRPVVVAGSTWPKDEHLLARLLEEQPGLRLVVAPHEVSSARISQLCSRFGDRALCLSDLKRQGGAAGGQGRDGGAAMALPGKNVLVVDAIGLLSGLYRFATLAYIGGGFGKGIHNILEAAAYGAPVFFGPRYGQFAEAVDLIGKGGAFCVRDAEGLKEGVARLLGDPLRLKEASAACRQYVEGNRGATERVLEVIRSFLADAEPAKAGEK